MLRFLAFPALAAAAPPRALADGSSGTLGADTVGAHEVRAGSLPLDKLASQTGGVLLGRSEGSGGPPVALSLETARGMLDRVATDMVVSSRELAQDLVPIAAARSLRLLGYGLPGDMGEALYLRTSSEPGHPGKFQTADGVWWELSGREAPPEVFGAAGDGLSDDSLAFRRAAEWSAATGGVVVGAPGATYRLLSGVAVGGGRFHGRGARIDFQGPVREVIFDFLPGAENVEVLNWRIETSRTSHIAVRCARVRGIRVEGIQLTRGCLFRSELVAGLTLAVLTEADLNHDLRIRGNICRGDGAPPDGGSNLAVVRLGYVLGAVAEGNDLRGYTGETTLKFSGIVWWGGDSNPSKDGGVGTVRWTRNLRIQGNRVSGVSSGGIWGSQGRDITCTGNTVEECGDIGIHGEGSDGISVTGNTMRNCRNGGFNPYFIEERAVYSSNSVVITDAATWGVTLVKQNMSFTAEAFEIVMANNVLEMSDLTAVGRVTLQRGGGITFEGNTLRNVVVDALNLNCGTRIIRGNHMLFPRDPQTHAIAAGRLRHPGSTRSAGLWVESNLIECWDWTPSGLHAAIYVGHTAAGPTEQPFAVIRSNDIRGWRDAATGELKGFAADILTESLDSNSLHVTEILNNRLWSGVVADITDGKAVDPGQLYRQRIKHNNNLSSRFDRIAPYDEGPRSGVFMRGSRGLNDAPDAGRSHGWAITGAISSAPSSGPWSSAAAYAFPDQVTGSDGAVYIAMSPSGPGAGGARNPVNVDGVFWRRIAPTPAVVAGLGDVST